MVTFNKEIITSMFTNGMNQAHEYMNSGINEVKVLHGRAQGVAVEWQKRAVVLLKSFSKQLAEDSRVAYGTIAVTGVWACIAGHNMSRIVSKVVTPKYSEWMDKDDVFGKSKTFVKVITLSLVPAAFVGGALTGLSKLTPFVTKEILVASAVAAFVFQAIFEGFKINGARVNKKAEERKELEEAQKNKKEEEKTETSKLKEEKKALQAQLEETQKNLENTEASAKDWEGKLTLAQEQLNKVTEEGEKTEEKVKGLQEQLETAEKQLRLKSEGDSAEVRGLTEQVKTLTEQLKKGNELGTQLNSKIQTLETELKPLKDEIEKQKEMISKLETAAKGKEEEINKLKKEHSEELEKAKKAHEEKESISESLIKAKDEEIKSFNTIENGLNEKIKAQEAKVSQLESEKKKVEEELNGQNGLLLTENKELKEINKELKLIKENLEIDLEKNKVQLTQVHKIAEERPNSPSIAKRIKNVFSTSSGSLPTPTQRKESLVTLPENSSPEKKSSKKRENINQTEEKK